MVDRIGKNDLMESNYIFYVCKYATGDCSPTSFTGTVD